LIRNSKTVFENPEPLSMKSLTRSQSARRRAAAAAAVASVGGGCLGTQSTEAAIVSIDLTNVNGQNFTGVNAGLSPGDFRTFYMNFGAAGILKFYAENRHTNYIQTGLQAIIGPVSLSYGGLANGGTNTTPTQFDLGNTIGGSASAFATGTYGGNPLFYYQWYGAHAAPNFDGYLGFLSSGDDGEGTNGVYGWIKATWDGTDFQLYSAAYESTPGVAIKAGDTGSAAAVPEIDPSGLASALSLVMGSAAMLEQRRRKRAAAATVAVTA
jgi:hypothetical protein